MMPDSFPCFHAQISLTALVTGMSAYYGSLNIVMNFVGYDLIDERSGDTGPGGDAALYLNNLVDLIFDNAKPPLTASAQWNT